MVTLMINHDPFLSWAFLKQRVTGAMITQGDDLGHQGSDLDAMRATRVQDDVRRTASGIHHPTLLAQFIPFLRTNYGSLMVAATKFIGQC